MSAADTRTDPPLLRVRGLVAGYRGVDAIHGVDLDVRRGETLGLVGESGCGKSTTGRAVLRLVEPNAGSVLFDGVDVLALDPAGLRRIRPRMQPVFQDPYGSLNPRLTAGDMLAEALRAHERGGSDPDARAAELLELVGLARTHLDHYPHELSGGQRQRLCIARALSVGPELLVLDEPVSALDVSIQAQVVNLLADLQHELGLTYLFIAHDLALVRHVSDRVAVMYLGRIVETGDAEAVYASPLHPYTRALLSAVPRTDPREPRARARTPSAGVPATAPPPSGCPFRPRCTHPLKDSVCASEAPPLESKSPGHFVACWKARFKGSDGG